MANPHRARELRKSGPILDLRSQEREGREVVAPAHRAAAEPDVAQRLQDAVGNRAMLEALEGQGEAGDQGGLISGALHLGLSGVDAQEFIPGTGSLSVMRDAVGASSGADEPGSPGVAPLLDRLSKHQGRPLPDLVRERMERVFGRDFRHVRVHADEEAAAASAAIDARAFTVGSDVFFGAGTYEPDGSEGQELLTHELAHVAQAMQGRTGPEGVSQPDDPLEQEARQVAAGAPADALAAPSALHLGHEALDSPGSTSQTILREEKTEIVMLADDWLTATPPSIQNQGTLTSELSGENVRIVAPKIVATSTAGITLPDDKKYGSDKPKVGPIQTLLSSERTAIYTKGDKTVERPKTMDQARDVREGTYGGPSDDAFAQAERPFYDKPVTVESDPWSGEIKLEDQPKFSVPKKIKEGDDELPLVQIQGSDEFNTSVGFKWKGEIHTKSPFEWSLSWNTPVAADGTAQPEADVDAITTSDTDEAVVVDSDDYANKLAREEFDSLEKAMAESASTLVQLLVKIRARNAESGGYIEQALTQKNPPISLLVTPLQGVGQEKLEGPSGVGGSVDVVVTPTITKTGSAQTVSVRQGTGDKVTFNFNDLADAAQITGGSVLVVQMHEEGHLGDAVAIPYPFAGSGQTSTAEGSEGAYRVETKGF